MRTQAALLSDWRASSLTELAQQSTQVNLVLSATLGESFTAALNRFNRLVDHTPEDRLRTAVSILNMTAESMELLDMLFDRSFLASAIIRDVQTMGRVLDFACSRAILALCTEQGEVDFNLADFSSLTAHEIHELNSIKAPESVLNILASNPDATLLEVSDSTMVLAFGDIDTAEHITTIIPGVGSQWDHYASVAKDFHTDGATIMWFGYTPPASLPAGVATHPATVGGENLHAFQDALRARTDAKLTVIGHSYGSVVVGHAASRSPLAADTLILAGSPGVPSNLKNDRVVVALTHADLIKFTTTKRISVHGEDPALNPRYEQWRLGGGHSDYLNNPEFRERVKSPATLDALG